MLRNIYATVCTGLVFICNYTLHFVAVENDKSVSYRIFILLHVQVYPFTYTSIFTECEYHAFWITIHQKRLLEMNSCKVGGLLSEGWYIAVEGLGHHIVEERQVACYVFCGPVTEEQVQQSLVPSC